MPKTTQTQTPSSVLSSLMDEYQLNPFSLSKEISLSHSAVRLIANGKGKISVATALRLAKYFDQTPEYWLDLQRASDLNKAKNNQDLMAIIKGITKAKKPTANLETKGSAKKTTLSDKRKTAAKVPGAKPASRMPPSTSKKKK